MSQTYSYREPVLSRWQAAAAEVSRQQTAVKSRITLQPARQDLMAPARFIGDTLNAGKTVDLAAAPKSVVGDCANTAAKFLWAEITGNQAQSQLLAGELKNSDCDPGWAECLVTYLGFKASGGSFPYRANLNPVFDLGAATRLAIVGDWGTGQKVAINLMRQVASLKPDVLIHLGDVYYAGTQTEEQVNFLSICREQLGGSVPLYSLCGNHDMYSGGNGYYWLVDQLEQQASYFCMQNADWQFLAMDTGHNDNNPLTVNTNMTSLVTQGSWSEIHWHLEKMQQAAGRRTVLLSHHPLFSPFATVGNNNGKPSAYNPNLYQDFQGVISQAVLWFWGHEHMLGVYDSYMGLERGRCVGASAVPVFTDQQSYTADSELQTYNGLPLPHWNSSVTLGNNGTDYNHAFAMMTLHGSAATVDYYQVPPLGTATKFSYRDQV